MVSLQLPVSRTVSVINPATNTVTATIGIGGNPVWAAVDPSTGDIFVTNSVNGTVTMISE
ncbi:YncE family protein [Mycobacterium vicinigordonae]|uniref:YncE family protein n=1 Tax=Mycobacterium vicinigordonae TaxID=1719132 RepID=UPI001FE4C778|nr:hypothetical protein [Mycobacterium vicinigordonae]